MTLTLRKGGRVKHTQTHKIAHADTAAQGERVRTLSTSTDSRSLTVTHKQTNKPLSLRAQLGGKRER